MKKSLIIIGIFMFANLVLAQEKNYFQQRANYNISVTLNDAMHQLTGFEKITYYNLSPDTLTKIYVHLWANGYSNRNTKLVEQQVNNGNTKLFYASPSQRGYIRNLDFKINGEPATYSSKKDESDIALIELAKPLLPGDSLTIETPFLVKIPGDFSRMGHQGQSYQITQWFPKIAVYDTKGWHPMPYLDMGEFYSNFGSYDVSITLPENYFVAATGVMIENNEEKNRIEERVKQSETSMFDETNYPISSTTLKTVRFYQDSIHDFAWFADKRFLISRKMVTLPLSQKKVTAYAYYLPTSRDIWRDVPNYIEETILFYSQKLGEYPYSSCTAVEGALAAGGGMEYPMITVVNTYDKKTTKRIVVHEVGHNWLYGIIGFNEREYPWLDEGLNSFYENEFFEQKYPKAHLLDDFKFLEYFKTNQYPDFYATYFAYLFTQSQFDYQPIGLTSEEYSMINYGVSVYYTPVMMFRFLKSYLGADEFDKIMFQFGSAWRFKHPLPSDVQHFLEQKSGKNLDWFFNKLIHTTKPINMRLSSVKKIKGQKEAYQIKTKDISRLGTPFSITVLDKKGNVLMEKWITPSENTHKDTLLLPTPAYKVVVNNQLDIPEVNKLDNEMRIHGLFKKHKLPKFSFLWRVSDPQERSILFAPVVGWNYYNRFMMGVAIYSDPIVSPKLDFLLMPMYSFTTQSLAGSADIGYSWAIPSLKIKKIRMGLFAKQYGNLFLDELNMYSKVEPSIQISFKTPANKNIAHEVKIRTVYVCQTTETPLLDLYWYHNEPMFEKNTEYSIMNLQYNFLNRRKINPWSVNIDAQLYKETVKVSFELKTQYTYAKNRGIDLRLFWGKISKPSTGFFPNTNFAMSGITLGYNGTNDYLFDHTMIGRMENTGFMSHQMIGNDGGFVTPTPIGRSSNWIAALNLKIRLPIKIPISVFGNIGTFPEADLILTNKERFVYEAGVSIALFRNIAEISIPLYVSKDIQRVIFLNNPKDYDRIRFILNLDALNPFKAVKRYKQITI